MSTPYHDHTDVNTKSLSHNHVSPPSFSLSLSIWFSFLFWRVWDLFWWWRKALETLRRFFCGSHGGRVGRGTVICRLLGVKIGVRNVQKNTVNYRKNVSCACLRGCVRVKKIGSSILNFWCYVACSLWDVSNSKNEPCVTLCPLADSLSVFFRTGLQTHAELWNFIWNFMITWHLQASNDMLCISCWRQRAKFLKERIHSKLWKMKKTAFVWTDFIRFGGDWFIDSSCGLSLPWSLFLSLQWPVSDTSPNSWLCWISLQPWLAMML